jgi:hypothetical protein
MLIQHLLFKQIQKNILFHHHPKSPRDAYSSQSPRTPTQFEKGSTEDYGQDHQ